MNDGSLCNGDWLKTAEGKRNHYPDTISGMSSLQEESPAPLLAGDARSYESCDGSPQSFSFLDLSCSLAMKYGDPIQEVMIRCNRGGEEYNQLLSQKTLVNQLDSGQSGTLTGSHRLGLLVTDPALREQLLTGRATDKALKGRLPAITGYLSDGSRSADYGPD